ncbi:MAG: protein kinase [Clostridia bacterium]|nr:protein kinase [Clostridia bacterium]
MAQDFDPVFGDWYTEKSLGSGTDGKAFVITRKNADGTVQRAVLKTIRVGDYRNEKKSFNKLAGEVSALPTGDTQRDTIIHNITENIAIIQQADGGRHFVRYEEWEQRATSDGKGTLILIRLEEMKSLPQLLEQFSLTEDEAVRLGISICHSLNRCRDFGYIYPNLKPENILFDRKGVCKLGDLGSFSCLEPSKTSVAYKRTQYYMAPEFIESGKINCTSDTYALGLVLYTLVNRGRLPFTEPYPQELTVASLDRSKTERLANRPLPRPALAGDGLWQVIRKACAFRPEERYLSPKQMLADLEHVLQHEPLEKTEFEDIFSRSDNSAADVPPAGPEPVPAPSDVELIPPAPPVYPGEEAQTVSRKDDTQIPDVQSQNSAAPDALPQTQKTAAPHVQQPQTGAPRKLTIPRDKKFWVLAAVAVLLLLLLIVSLALKAGGKEPGAVQTAAVITSFFDGGAFFWPLI